MLKEKNRAIYFKYQRFKMRKDIGLREGCGKICYLSKRMAKSAAKSVIHSGHEKKVAGKILKPYYCQNCESFHIGHTREI